MTSQKDLINPGDKFANSLVVKKQFENIKETFHLISTNYTWNEIKSYTPSIEEEIGFYTNTNIAKLVSHEVISAFKTAIKATYTYLLMEDGLVIHFNFYKWDPNSRRIPHLNKNFEEILSHTLQITFNNLRSEDKRSSDYISEDYISEIDSEMSRIDKIRKI